MHLSKRHTRLARSTRLQLTRRRWDIHTEGSQHFVGAEHFRALFVSSLTEIRGKWTFNHSRISTLGLLFFFSNTAPILFQLARFYMKYRKFSTNERVIEIFNNNSGSAMMQSIWRNCQSF